jgi:hypothetical protein
MELYLSALMDRDYNKIPLHQLTVEDQNSVFMIACILLWAVVYVQGLSGYLVILVLFPAILPV